MSNEIKSILTQLFTIILTHNNSTKKMISKQHIIRTYKQQYNPQQEELTQVYSCINKLEQLKMVDVWKNEANIKYYRASLWAVQRYQNKIS